MVTVSIHHGDFVYYFTFYCNFTINSYCECNAFRFFVTIWCGCFCQSIVTRLQTYLMSIRFIFSIGRPLCYYLITFCEGQGSSVEFVASHIGLADNYVMVTVFVHHCNCTYGFSIYFYISFFVYNKDDAFGFFVTVWCCGFCQSVSSRIKLYFMVFSFFRSPALHLLILIIGYCKLCAGNFISGNIHFFNDYFAIRIIVCHDDFFHCSIIYGYSSVDSYIKGNIGCYSVTIWCRHFNQYIITRLQAEFFHSFVGGPAFYLSSVFICYFKLGSRKLSSRYILLADFYRVVTVSIHHGNFVNDCIINCDFAVFVHGKGDGFCYFVTIRCCGFCQGVGSRLQTYRMAVWLCRCVRCPLCNCLITFCNGQGSSVKLVASHVFLADDYVMVTVFIHHINCTYSFSTYFYISFFVYNKGNAFGFFVTTWCLCFCQGVGARIKLYFMVFSFFRNPALHNFILIISYLKLCAGNFISGNIHFFNDYFAIRIIVCHDDFFHCSIIYGYGSVDSYIKGNIG